MALQATKYFMLHQFFDMSFYATDHSWHQIKYAASNFLN
jgi:hypothetical protein